jgi:hypothetical protein
MLCDYKDALGKVGTGVHSYRIFNIAVVDVVLTVLLAYIIYLFVPGYNFLLVLLACFISGIALHRLFCVRTTIDKALFPNVKA